MKTLYILNYNNYFNRLVKREEELSEYEPYVIYMLSNVNFNENDGIDTEHVIGSVEAYDGSGDYMLAVDEDTRQIQRWFILEAQRTRGGQYRVMLRRDIIADWKGIILEAPAFIEKANVNYDDVAIYNSENMRFNQIKTSQELLKETGGLAWLVAYMEKSTTIPEKTIPAYDENTLVVNGIENWEYYRVSTLANEGTFKVLTDETKFSIYATGPAVNDELRRFDFSIDNGAYSGNVLISSNISTSLSPYMKISAIDFSTVSFKDAFLGWNIKSDIESATFAVGSLDEINYNRIYDESTGRLYSLNIRERGIGKKEISVRQNNDFARIYTTAFARLKANLGNHLISDGEEYSYKIRMVVNQYVFEVIEIPNTTDLKYEIRQPHNTTTGEVFDILAIPYGTYFFGQKDGAGVSLNYITKDSAIKFASSIAEAGDAQVYDVQLLPYNPVRELDIEEYYDTTIRSSIAAINVDEDILNSNKTVMLYIGEKPTSLGDFWQNIRGIGFWVTESKFSFQLNSPKINVKEEDFKIENDCSLWRLNSPNWASTFEFNVVKNGGSVSWWNVDCHYKPYTPYINVAPNFSGLYGQSFENEARGLILAGDFSISRVKDQWVNYQLNNKTYEMAFNRQIQSIEVQNDIQHTRDIVGAVAGTAQGTASGAMTGAMSGGGVYGAIAGAVVGGVTSGVAGAIDVSMNERLRKEQLDLTKDLYGYNLQTIKARPDTLTNVSAINNDNTIFPNLEYYTCSETEKQALRNKIKYNGMTVMRIGTISEFISNEPSFIKARLIRLEYTGGDFHLVNAIAEELFKGVFI